jgi:hypothetical protein
MCVGSHSVVPCKNLIIGIFAFKYACSVLVGSSSHCGRSSELANHDLSALYYGFEVALSDCLLRW